MSEAPDRHRRVRALFERVREEPPERRAAALATACAGDPELHAEVASLLSAAARADSFLEQPAAAALAQPQRLVGRRFGPYEVHSVIGAAIRCLVERGQLERSLFDETNLAEIRAPEFPGERLIACFNPLLSAERKRKREELLQATEKALGHLEAEVKRRTKKPLGKAEIGVKAGRVLASAFVSSRVQ